MKFTADLHIHSKFSRATSKNLDFENLYHAAQIKGLKVVGTGDFTHPDWIEQIETKLEPAEPGLFRLKDDVARTIDPSVPASCRAQVRFILQAEISCIYKKDGRVRKNHNLIYFPAVESAKSFNATLSSIGNITSDGRPILGLDAAKLLELMLEVDESGFFVPAHIWTPWFSLFGSKSGFDAIEECFGDLSSHIFAVETGLSSDPPMNWRVKNLDRVSLISNSDAHSPGYLGRNATVFNTQLGFAPIRKALETQDPEAFQGTLDMYPHHGKYHYDGHRKCDVCLNPAETARLSGICPKCGRQLTLGVLYRVQELADRPEGYQPDNRHGFKHIIPLADVLAEIFQVGPKTKKVAGYYDRAVSILGPELDILADRSIDEIRRANVPLLAEAIDKMRKGQVNIAPGYDGEFGKVGIFTREEKEILQGERYPLFELPKQKKKAVQRPVPKHAEKAVPEKKKDKVPFQRTASVDLLSGLNPEQKKAVESKQRAVIIQAGPGTGKTRTLTAAVARLVAEEQAEPKSILALTFTNKAARELADRIDAFLAAAAPGIERAGQPTAATYHAFCLDLLRSQGGFDRAVADDDQRRSLIRQAVSLHAPEKGSIRQMAARAGRMISHCKQMLLGPEDDLAGFEKEQQGFTAIYEDYQALCREHQCVDFEDLIAMSVQKLRADPAFLETIQDRYAHIFVDEYQDLNSAQYELTRLLAGKARIMVIGDPDQSIYGFRGSDLKYFKAFSDDFPGCEFITLTRNYRSAQTILDASFQMISKAAENHDSVRIFSDEQTAQKLIIKETSSEAAEAAAIGKMIEALMGGTSFLSMDAGRAGQDMEKEYSFADFAVLYRTRRQADAFIQAFEAHGIPFQTADSKAWYDLPIVKVMVSLCRIAAKRASDNDYEQVASIMKKNADEIRKRFQPSSLPGVQDAGAGPALKTLCKKAGLKPLVNESLASEQAFDTLAAMADGCESLTVFLDRLALNQDADVVAADAEKVSLMTLHAAKGLEFPVVFVTGCEQGMIPFARDGETIDDPEEERRLFYVAMTRAMDILCLTYAKKRRIYGINKKRQRSIFIDDIEKQLIQMEKQEIKAGPMREETQLELF